MLDDRLCQLRCFSTRARGRFQRQLRSWGHATVHSRLRGADGSALASSTPVAGSSPRARGPTRRIWWLTVLIVVHPRRCGAAVSLSRIPSSSSRGSSPRPRGRSLVLSAWVPDSGSSPRARGRANRDRHNGFRLGVHPRVREAAGVALEAGYGDRRGSSPQARGWLIVWCMTSVLDLGSSPPVLFVSGLYVPDSSSLTPPQSSLPANTASQMCRRIRTVEQR